MENKQTLNAKKVLIVDDEPDMIESLEELLEDMFMVDSASSFERAVACLKNNSYDVAILDIMGVRGYDLLEATQTLGIPTLMLTAHALSPDNLKKSFELGADAYIPKHKMVDISIYVEDVLSSRQNKRKNNFKWYSKFMPLFDKLFGEGWKDPEKEFWDEFDKKHILAELTWLFNSESSIDTVLEAAMYKISHYMDSERASIFLADTSKQRLFSFSSLDLNKREICISKSSGVAGWVFENRQPVIVNNPYDDNRFYSGVDETTGFRTRNLICAPLIGNGDCCFGTLQLLNKKNGDFTTNNLDLLCLTAQLVAVAIKDSKLYDKIKSTNSVRGNT